MTNKYSEGYPGARCGLSVVKGGCAVSRGWAGKVTVLQSTLVREPGVRARHLRCVQLPPNSSVVNVCAAAYVLLVQVLRWQ
jgi:hypothetical protein